MVHTTYGLAHQSYNTILAAGLMAACQAWPPVDISIISHSVHPHYVWDGTSISAMHMCCESIEAQFSDNGIILS